MSTPTLKVMTAYCEHSIDDENLIELKTADAPLYSYKMYGYLRMAIPFITLPAELQSYLIDDFTEPMFNSAVSTVTEDKTTNFIVPLGEDYARYEIACCRIKQVDYFGNVTYVPVEIQYIDAIGSVVVTATEENPIPAGSVLTFDFYKDGAFAHNLTPEVMSIIATAFELAWNIRFSENWLDRKPKIDDKSFSTQNIANKQNSDTARIEEIKRRLAGQMRRFEKNKWNLRLVRGEQ